jgi:glutaminyl-tRNA synthetase
MNAILNPLKLIIDNYPDDQVEYVEAENNRNNPELGSRKMPFSKVVYIERDDFIKQKPNKKWKRLALDVEVRLMHAYFVKANSIETDEDGNITAVHCTYDPATKSGSGFNERKPNGNIHYVDGTHHKQAEFRLFDDLVLDMEDKNVPFEDKINPDSLISKYGVIEESINPKEGDRYQFIRNGYYAVDPDTTSEHPVFNRVVGLRSSFKPKAKK